MTTEEFQKEFYLEFKITETLHTLEIVTSAFRKNDKKNVDEISTSINIKSTSEWINNSQHPISINKWSWQSLIDKTKRAQLDYFAMRVPIENFYPLNDTLHPSIEEFYIK